MQNKKKRLCFNTIMNKEALLHIILSEINEVETLVKSFQGKQEIPSAFIDLTERKLAQIIDEFSLLKTLATGTETNQKEEQLETSISKEEILHTESIPEVKPEEPVKSTPEKIESEDLSNDEMKETHETKTEKIEDIHEDTIKGKDEPDIVLTNESPSISISKEKNNTPPVETSIQSEKSRTLGESFAGEKKSVNDKIASSHESGSKKTLIGKPVNDLTKGLGINDRFMFQRELFEGNAEVMQQTLQQLNELPNLEAAQSFISSNFNWDSEQEATKAFYNYIVRKY